MDFQNKWSDRPNIEDIFADLESRMKHKLKRSVSDEVLAQVVLADAIRNVFADTDCLSHAICMGMRMGLFGADSPCHTSIKDLSVNLDGCIGVDSGNA